MTERARRAIRVGSAASHIPKHERTRDENTPHSNPRGSCAVLGVVAFLSQPAWALTPFSGFVQLNTTSGEGFGQFTVPSNQTFVVEYVSGRISVPVGAHIIEAMMFEQGNPGAGVVYPTPQLLSSAVQDTYTFSNLVRAYHTGTVSILVSVDTSIQSNITWSTTDYLLPTLTGDYSANGTVGADDYVAYRKTLSQFGQGLFADDNENNKIDPPDYGVWRASFGNTGGGNPPILAGAGVPEPTTATLATLTALGWMCTRRRR